jgi:hypothetical protein
MHSFHNTGQVGGKDVALAVTDLPPQIRAALATAATKEQVVIDLVIRCRAGAVKESRGCAFQGDHYGGVVLVRIDVPSKAVRFPSEAVGVVEPAVDGLPVLCSGFLNIVIRGHSCKS